MSAVCHNTEGVQLRFVQIQHLKTLFRSFSFLNVNIFLRSVRDFCEQKLNMKLVSVLVIILQYSKKSMITMG